MLNPESSAKSKRNFGVVVPVAATLKLSHQSLCLQSRKQASRPHMLTCTIAYTWSATADAAPLLITNVGPRAV